MSQRSVNRAHQRRLESQARRLRRLGLVAGAALGTTALTASAAQAETYVVDTLADPEVKRAQRVDDATTLRAAVEAANATAGPDSITFATGLTGTIRLNGTPLEVAPGGLTITGPGSQVLAISGDADDSGTPNDVDSRIVDVTESATLGLSGLELTRGFAESCTCGPGGFKYGGGAAFVDYGATLDVSEVAFTANTTDDSGAGGAIVSLGTTTVTGSSFSGNSAPVGGAIFHFPFPVSPGPTRDRAEPEPVAVSRLDVDGSTFDGNAALGGGAIAVVDVIRVKYDAETAAGNAVTVTGSTFTENEAVSNGGAVFGATVGPEVIPDARRRSVAPETDRITLDRNTFVDNTSGYQGGALDLLSTPDVPSGVSRSTFTGNTAQTGGAIVVRQSLTTGPPTRRKPRAATPVATGLELDSLTISGNTAQESGGGVWLEPAKYEDDSTAAGAVVVTNSIVAGNTTDGAPGDLGQPTTDAAGDGFVLRHSLVQTPGSAPYTVDPARPSLLGIDPKLATLADNGGPTKTLLPATDSPAVDAGSSTAGLTTDQRGTARPVDQPGTANAVGGDGTDVGAVELALPAPEPTPEPPAPAPAQPAAPVPAATPPAPAAGTSVVAPLPIPISRPGVVAKKTKQPLILRGTAGKGTTKVRVSVAKKVGSKCKFLLASGKFSAQRDCRRTLYVTAQGTTIWKLQLPVLSKGKYTVWSRAIVSGRLELKKTTQNFRRFEIK